MSKRKLQQPGKGGKKIPCTEQTTVFKYFQPVATDSASSSSPSLSKPSFTESPQAFGVHCYSEAEIQSAFGLQQDYRRFWNEKAVELCSDRSVRANLGYKGAIKGAIDSAWTMHKTEILRLQAEMVTTKSKQLYSDDATHLHEISSISSNVDRMLQACTSVNVTYTEIDNTSSLAEKAKLEIVLKDDMSELKKAQAALQKAIKEKNKIIQAEELEGMFTADSLLFHSVIVM